MKLTVEEIYPENLALTPGDPSVNVINSPLEILPGPSNEHINHDIVDPFSQMDPEQLQRLEHALASEQAKQILGENVAAMLGKNFLVKSCFYNLKDVFNIFRKCFFFFFRYVKC